MADVIITFRVLPQDVNVNLNDLKDKIINKIEKFDGKIGEVKLEPFAFGLKSLNIIFILDESKGGTDLLESEIKKIKGVSNIEVVDVRRSIG